MLKFDRIEIDQEELRWKRIGAYVVAASATFTVSVIAWMVWVAW